MNRLGILGGTFDPIHLGHLRMAQVVLEKMKLDQVVFVPSNFPPHKSAVGLSPAAERLHLVRLAIRGNLNFAVSSFETQRGGKSYSIDTIRYFAKNFPIGNGRGRSPLFFIIGYDAFAGLHKWKAIDEILKMAEFVVVNRPGNFKNPHSIKHHSVIMPGIDISSSSIRRLVKQKKSIRYLVPEAVRGYIEKNGLYK